MGTRGPKALPSNVHKMNGNRSKLSARQLNSAVEPDVVIPKCPGHLLPVAKKEWKRISVQLEKLGLVTEMDMAALAVYCQAYARWVGAELKLKKEGEDALVESTPSGYKQIAVWLQISNRAVEQMHKFMAEFGMSPSSRSRVTASSQLSLFPEDDNGEQKGTNYFS